MKTPLIPSLLLAVFAMPVGAQQTEEGWSDSGALKFEVREEKDADN